MEEDEREGGDEEEEYRKWLKGCTCAVGSPAVNPR